MVVTVYETMTDGSDGLGLLTTLERATITQVATATDGDEVDTILGSSSSTSVPSRTNISEPLATAASTAMSTPAPSTAHTSNIVPSSTAAPISSSAQLSTGSIVGIALGSVVGVIIILVCILFTLCFRIQRAKLRRYITPTEESELRDERLVVASTPDRPYEKAELADSEYLQKVERLHEGSKAELEGSTTLKSVWRPFSIRFLRTRGLRESPAELASDPLESGPHELPGEGVLQSSSEEPRGSQDAT